MFNKNNAGTALKKAAYRQGARGDWKYEPVTASTPAEPMAKIVTSTGREFTICGWELDRVADLTWSEVKSM